MQLLVQALQPIPVHPMVNSRLLVLQVPKKETVSNLRVVQQLSTLHLGRHWCDPNHQPVGVDTLLLVLSKGHMHVCRMENCRSLVLQVPGIKMVLYLRIMQQLSPPHSVAQRWCDPNPQRPVGAIGRGKGNNRIYTRSYRI